MGKILIITLAGILLFSSCGPIGKFTKLQKLPREYSENYSIEGIKAPKSEAHQKPWVVYSDRMGDAAYVNPGGKVKAADVNPWEAFLVIKKDGDYLRLIKYNAENIKNNRFAEPKKAKYVGWMHSSRLILSPLSITDVRSGLHDKLLIAIGDTSAIMAPEQYLATADSLKVFGDPELQKQKGSVGLHTVVYALKYSSDGRSVLVAKASDITVEKIGEQIVGWVPKVMLKEIGRQIFASTSLSGGVRQPDILKYSPVIRPYYVDSMCVFRSGVFVPVIDKTDNKVFNIDGEAISFNQSKRIKQNLKQINILFSMEQSPNLPEQFPMLLNAIQNLRPLFAPGTDESFVFSFAAVVATNHGVIETIPLTSNYDTLVDRLTDIHASMKSSRKVTLPIWSALKRSLTFIDHASGAVNLVIEIGSGGNDMMESAPVSIVEMLNKLNCRLLGWQLYASNEDRYNNYVLQLTNMIQQYADYQTANKRKITLYADQFCPSNLMREVNRNFFMLDYPFTSMSQGGVYFPEKGETLSMDLFAGAVDTIVSQIQADHRLLSESIDRAYTTVGNTKDRFDTLLVKTYHLPQSMKPGKDFKKMFDGTSPIWYKEVPRVTVPDSLMRYRLLLSEPELKQMKERVETLCALEVDVKDKTKPKKGKTKKLCRYLEETENDDDEENNSMQVNPGTKADTVYVSTKKVRRHLYNFYMSELRSCKVCQLKRKEIKRYTLAFAHRQVFGVPANGPLLEDVTVKGLKRHKKLSDAELDALVAYFKHCKEEFGKKFAQEQFSSAGQEYYYIDSKLLP